MNRLLGICVFAYSAFAQTLTFSHQPLDSLQAISYSVPRSVAIYRASACAVAPVEISGGAILQAAERHIAVIDPTLIDATILRARKKSKKYRALLLAQYGAAAATLYLSSVSGLPVSARVIPAAVAFLGQEAAKAITPSATPPTSTLHFWRTEERLTLSAGQCVSGLIGARWDGHTERF